MLSIIICSRNKTLPVELVSNIKDTVGVDYELIHIDNSENKYSIFTAYNSGIAISKYPYLCFVHEDVLFHSASWGERVIAHLQNPKTGIIGVAGADLALRVPASWANLISPSQNIIQTDPSGVKPSEYMLHPAGYSLSKRSTITLDGIFLCMRREITNQLKFDEQLSGFHGYDYDISLQSHVAGYTNYVIYDIKLEHSSKGKTSILYFRNLISIYKKFEKYLPIIGENISAEERKDLLKLEEKKLRQLTKKMIRKGFESKEIISEITYFSRIIGSTKSVWFLKFRIFFFRVFNAPAFLFK